MIPLGDADMDGAGGAGRGAKAARGPVGGTNEVPLAVKVAGGPVRLAGTTRQEKRKDK